MERNSTRNNQRSSDSGLTPPSVCTAYDLYQLAPQQQWQYPRQHNYDDPSMYACCSPAQLPRHFTPTASLGGRASSYHSPPTHHPYIHCAMNPPPLRFPVGSPRFAIPPMWSAQQMPTGSAAVGVDWCGHAHTMYPPDLLADHDQLMTGKLSGTSPPSYSPPTVMYRDVVRPSCSYRVPADPDAVATQRDSLEQVSTMVQLGRQFRCGLLFSDMGNVLNVLGYIA